MWRNLESIIKNSDNFNQEKIEEYNKLLKTKDDLINQNKVRDSEIQQLEDEYKALRMEFNGKKNIS